MDEFEFAILILSAYFTVFFFLEWYRTIQNAWPPFRARTSKTVLRMLPATAFLIFFITLKFFTAPSVKDSPLFLTFYLVLGFFCLNFLVLWMGRVFDITWENDVLHLDNPAALPAFCSGFLALALIYSGANVGDGPGWWCVIFAGALGSLAWYLLGAVINQIAGVSERITVDRDMGCSLRFGGYFLASGIVLSRASAGDWTSFGLTVREFMDGWPVLLLAASALTLELVFSALRRRTRKDYLAVSAALGLAYITASVIIVMLMPPMNQNPIYYQLPY